MGLSALVPPPWAIRPGFTLLERGGAAGAVGAVLLGERLRSRRLGWVVFLPPALDRGGVGSRGVEGDRWVRLLLAGGGLKGSLRCTVLGSVKENLADEVCFGGMLGGGAWAGVPRIRALRFAHTSLVWFLIPHARPFLNCLLHAWSFR